MYYFMLCEICFYAVLVVLGAQYAGTWVGLPETVTNFIAVVASLICFNRLQRWMDVSNSTRAQVSTALLGASYAYFDGEKTWFRSLGFTNEIGYMTSKSFYVQLDRRLRVIGAMNSEKDMVAFAEAIRDHEVLFRLGQDAKRWLAKYEAEQAKNQSKKTDVNEMA